MSKLDHRHRNYPWDYVREGVPGQLRISRNTTRRCLIQLPGQFTNTNLRSATNFRHPNIDFHVFALAGVSRGTVARLGVATISDTLTLSVPPQSRFDPVGSEAGAGRYLAQNSLAHQKPWRSAPENVSTPNLATVPWRALGDHARTLSGTMISARQDSVKRQNRRVKPGLREEDPLNSSEVVQFSASC